MSDLDWSRLLKQQAEFVQRDNQRQIQRKLRIKELYRYAISISRQQLQKIIREQNDRQLQQKTHDKRIIKWANERQKIKIITEAEETKRKIKLIQQAARQNLRSIQNKKYENSLQNQEQKKFYISKYRKATTQAKQQETLKMKQRQQQKEELSRAYDYKIQQQKYKRLNEKLEDEKFSMLRQQIEQKKQKNRRMLLEKLKGGYRQNPQVYQLSKNIISHQQKERSEFIKKMSTDSPTSFLQQPRIKQEEQKIKRIIQASKFNKNYFQQKSKRQRQKSIEQTSSYARINRSLQSQLKYQRQMHLHLMQQKKLELRNQLQRQIDQQHSKNSRKNVLSYNQSLINKSGQIPALPGLNRDYSNEKQFHILQKFLEGKSSKNISRPF